MTSRRGRRPRRTVKPAGKQLRLTFMAMSAILAGCEDQSPPAPVNTTIPAPLPAILTGELSYPSDYIPDDMQVCAESVTSDSSHCGAQFFEQGGRRHYRLELPAGRYYVYARVPGMDYRAYYTEAVPCGLSIECPSHARIVIEARPGETLEEIDPGDWYAPT